MQKAYSHSSLSSFERCPRKYWFRYVAKLPVDTEGIEAFVGKRVHEVLERLYRFVDEGMVPGLPRVLWRYRQNWEQHYDPARVRIVRQGTDAAFYRGQGERCLENYYRRHYPFDADRTLGLERKVHFHLNGDDRYAVRGFIDRVVRAADGVLEIHDFKTGRRVPSQQDLDRDRQLALYEIGMRHELDETGPVRLVWHFVLSDQRRCSTRTPDDLAALTRDVRALVDRIRAERDWQPRKTALCDWCEYQPYCPAFGGTLPDAVSPPERREPDTPRLL